MSEVAVAPVTAPAVVVPPVAAPAEVTVATPPVQPAPVAESVKATAAVPETYAEFKAEGVKLNAEAVTKWNETAKSAGLTQDQYDAALKFQTEFVKSEVAAYEAQLAAEEAARPAAIMAAIASDPILGGKDAVANAATVQRAVEAFGGKEFKAFLDKQPVASHVQFARYALAVGKAIKEDSSAGTIGSGTSQKTEKDLLKEMYPNSPEMFGKS